MTTGNSHAIPSGAGERRARIAGGCPCSGSIAEAQQAQERHASLDCTRRAHAASTLALSSRCKVACTPLALHTKCALSERLGCTRRMTEPNTSHVNLLLGRLREVLRSSPDNVPELCRIGRELAELGRPDEVRRPYRAAVEVLHRHARAGNVDLALMTESAWLQT